MKYILTNSNLFGSAQRLSEIIEEKTGVVVEVTTILGRENIIRWGNSGNMIENDTKYNAPNLINISGNKKRFSTFLINYSIPCVEFFNSTPTQFPIVCRKTLNGMGGAGISICRALEEFNGDVWSPWYSFGYELGVHVLGGEIAKIFKKVREDGLHIEEFPIRNSGNGYRFSLHGLDNFPGLQGFISKIYREFPIQFARFDIGWDELNKTYRVIECNSAPALTHNKNTLNMYAEFLVNRLEI